MRERKNGSPAAQYSHVQTWLTYNTEGGKEQGGKGQVPVPRKMRRAWPVHHAPEHARAARQESRPPDGNPNRRVMFGIGGLATLRARRASPRAVPEHDQLMGKRRSQRISRSFWDQVGPLSPERFIQSVLVHRFISPLTYPVVHEILRFAQNDRNSCVIPSLPRAARGGRGISLLAYALSYLCRRVLSQTVRPLLPRGIAPAQASPI